MERAQLRYQRAVVAGGIVLKASAAMKWLLIIVLLCGIANAGCTSPCVQVKNPVCNGASPLSCAYGSNVTAGNLLIAEVMTTVASATLGASGSLNGTFTAVGTAQACGGGAACIHQLFYFPNSASGAETVTCTATAGTPQCIITEWSGIITSNPLDQSGYGGNGSSTSQATPNITDGQATDTIYACEANAGNGGTKTVASPYTIDGSGNTTKLACGWQTVSSTSVTGATFTLQFANAAAVGTFSFKQTGGTAVQGTLPLLGAGPGQ